MLRPYIARQEFAESGREIVIEMLLCSSTTEIVPLSIFSFPFCQPLEHLTLMKAGGQVAERGRGGTSKGYIVNVGVFVLPNGEEENIEEKCVVGV